MAGWTSTRSGCKSEVPMEVLGPSAREPGGLGSSPQSLRVPALDLHQRGGDRPGQRATQAAASASTSSGVDVSSAIEACRSLVSNGSMLRNWCCRT